jgi:hypothetical protein
MTPSNNLTALLSFFLPSLPACIVWLVGIAVALATWRRHPRVSQTALVACVLLLVSASAGAVAQYWLIFGVSRQGWTVQQYGRMIGLVTLVRVAFSTVGYVLLLVAVFNWRSTPRLPAGPVGEPFAGRPANLPGGETAIQADEPRP